MGIKDQFPDYEKKLVENLVWSKKIVIKKMRTMGGGLINFVEERQKKYLKSKNCKTHYRSESSACSCKYCKIMGANILSLLSNYF